MYVPLFSGQPVTGLQIDSRALRSDGELNRLRGKRGETGVRSFFPLQVFARPLTF